MATAPPRPALLGITAAARLLNLSADHVRHLADTGQLSCERDSANRRVFRTEVVVALMKRRQKLPASRRNGTE